MSQEEIKIPKGWKLKRLDEVGCYFNGRAFKPTEWSNSGLPIIRIQNLTGSSSTINYFDGIVEEKNLIKNDDLLISWSATIDVFLWSGNNAVLNQHIFKVKPLINKKFLYYTLQFSLPILISKIHGAGIKHITYGKFKETLVPIPPPNIQKKIVQKLDQILVQLKEKENEIFSLIEQNKKRIDLFEKNWRKYLISTILVKSNTKNDWEEVTFDDVCKKITYGFTNPMPHVEEGPWLITAKNIKNGIVDYTNALKTDWKSFNGLISDKSRPKIGTVVIIKDGATIGRVGIIDKENTCISQSVGSLETIKSKILPNFLSLILTSSEIQSKISEDAKQNTIPHIQITVLANWKFFLPSLNIQREIIQNINNAEEKFKEQITKLKNIKENYESRIKYIEYIQSSILDTAFSGKLVN